MHRLANVTARLTAAATSLPALSDAQRSLATEHLRLVPLGYAGRPKPPPDLLAGLAVRLAALVGRGQAWLAETV